MNKKEKILRACLACAEKHGFNNMTRQQIAELAKVPESLVSYYLGSMENTRSVAMLEAIQKENLNVLSQGLAFSHPVANKAPLHLKVRVSHKVVGDV